MNKLRYIPCCFNCESEKKVCWLLTRNCNLNCKHCAVQSYFSNLKSRISLGDISDKLRELKKQKISKIILSGGEPTLVTNLPEVIKYLSQQGFDVSITTNGTMIDIQYAKKLKGAGLYKATVSLDGSKPTTHDLFRGEKGAFSKAVKGIKTLIKVGVAVTINVTLHDKLISELEEIVKLALRLSVKKLSFVFPLSCGRVLINKSLFYQVVTNKEEIIYRIEKLSSIVPDDMQILILNPICESEECPSNKLIFGIDEFGNFGECLFKTKSSLPS